MLNRFRAWIRNWWEASKRVDPARSTLWGEVVDSRHDLSTYTRHELVRKSRYWEKNSALANRLCDLFELYTVGPTGLPFNPTSLDAEWNSAAKIYLAGWAPLADIASRQGWSVMQSLVARRWFFDGEVFILKTRGTGSPAHPRLQLIETHRVSTPPDMTAQEGKTIFDGIQVDARTGRPLVYWVQNGFSDDSFTPISADLIIHVFEPSRTGQLRGIPFLSAVLNDLNDLHDLQMLEMRAAKDAAEVANVIATETGEGKATSRTVRERFQITTQKSDGTQVTENRAEYVRRALGGRTVALKVGESLQQFRSERPTAATNGYWDRLETQICAGVGIPRGLVYATSLQGTVARADYDVAAAFFKARCQVLITAFSEVYAYVLWSASQIDLSIADKPETWRSVSIRQPASVNVDKGRISAAQINGLKAGTETLDSILGPQGIDWMEHILQIKAERDFSTRMLGSPSAAVDALAQQQQQQQQDQVAA